MAGHLVCLSACMGLTSSAQDEACLREECVPEEGGSWRLQDYDVAEVMGKVLLFFEAQEAGLLRVGHRVPWRGPSYLDDGKAAGLDLSGGWFDAGGTSRRWLEFTSAWWSVPAPDSQIAWGMHTGREVLQRTSFQGQSNMHWALQTLKHGVTYLLACHPEPEMLVVQVGESHPDHQNWGRPEADSHTPRTVYTISPSAPGADAAAAAAAALAAAAVALSQHTGSCDSELRQQCLEHARALFAFARAYPGCYSVSVPECANTYTSDGFAQYMFLGAAWLAMATREAAFEEEAALWQGRADTKAYWMAYGWDWVYIGACAVMWGLSRLERYEKRLRRFCNAHYNCEDGVKRTPCGLTFLSKWGSCRAAAGIAGVVAFWGLRIQATEPEEGARALEFAERQVCYMLGATGHSWVTGFGRDPPCRVHHKGASLRADQNKPDWGALNSRHPNPNLLVGALTGGPDVDGKWADDRKDYVGNEVALDYNAAFFLALVQCAVGREAHS